MIRFNVIGKGFIEMADGGVGVTRKSPWWRFADVMLSRSVEFTVPATDANRALFGYGEDPAEAAMEMRTTQRCQMIYDGGVVNGEIVVTAYDGNGFSCVFYAMPEWVKALQGKKLSECVCTLNDVVWSKATPVVDADQADWTQVQLVKYDNGIGDVPTWQIVPSVNVMAYIFNIFQNLGVTVSGSLGTRHWLIAGSMRGRDVDSVTFSQTADDTASVTQSAGLIGMDRVDIDWATSRVFGTYLGGGTTNADVFMANEDIKLTMGTVGPDIFLIKYDFKLGRCECLGGYSSSGEGRDMSGQTIELSRGDRFFFGDRSGNLVNYDIILTGGAYFGWKGLANTVTITAEVSVDRDIVLGDTWRLQDNIPDMTLFEFVKGVCIALGYELVIEDNRIRFTRGLYGIKGRFKALENVVSVNHVRRNVAGWGDDTRGMTIVFDSDKYVTDTISSPYYVQNDTLEGEKETKIPFSEGNVGDYGVLVSDVKADGGAYKFDATKWTLARVIYNGTNKEYLQRVETPDFEGYSDIADSSTCVKVKVLASVAEFFDILPQTTFVWRGMCYVWTDADWSNGIMSLTLQKVSQQVTYEKPLPYDAKVEYLESTGAQYINTGFVPNNESGFLVQFKTLQAQSLYMFGSRIGSTVTRIFVRSSASYEVYAGWANATPHSTYDTEGVAMLNYDNDRKFVVNGLQYGSNLVDLGFTPTLTTYLFAYNNDNTASNLYKGRISQFTITQGVDVVMDLIPVRVGSVGYMYDRVSGQLFGNDGTGDFVVGPDV